MARGKTSGAADTIDPSEAMKDQGGAPYEVEDHEDQPTPAPRARAKGKSEDDEADERLPPHLEYEVDPRDALAKSFSRDRTAGKMADPDVDTDDDEADDDGNDPEVVIVRGEDRRETRPTTVAKATTDLSDDTPVTMVVDGAKVTLTLKEMRDRAQIQTATGNRLDEVNRLLDDARARVNSLPAPRAGDDPARSTRTEDAPDGRDPSAAPRTTKTKVDPARMTSVVDKIQSESPEVAGAELARLIEEVASPAQTNGEDQRTIVREEIAMNDAKGRTSAAFASVYDSFPDVMDDPRLGQMASQEAFGEVLAQLKSIGVPDADFNRPAMDIILGYEHLRSDPNWGSKLKPLNTVFAEKAKALRVWRTGSTELPESFRERRGQDDGGRREEQRREDGNSPARIVRTSTVRADRKSGLTPQPRSASVRTDASSIAPRRRDNSAVVAQMAVDRRQ